ncbi:HAD family hydrolase [Flavilitoribacter nigricans]|uniref:phosphoglycolate phosphatase n=1 Tax=Flavilitoribacter nigricans (strain ATCC 23147 / DSM 23189 / NBRC 102662 / NCIMB 1420 / SS-2) TaxID=1122177 RepID=A0A2D0NEH8_FLAN2|nr:HAD hydrolase-like protein [Flavilitoribacter nigricans]PHN06589.1 haloacid dehalogenase-like hydrolase [Flavilitoribacter nigricans DSM 23189 = NBRC 102662]
MILIIFDLDGTLVYSNRIDSRCFAETYANIYGQEFPSIDWHVYPHVTDTSIFSTVIREQFGREVDPAEVETFQEAFVRLLRQRRQEQPEEFCMVPGARDLVHYLHERHDYAVGIATGGWQRPAILKLDHVGINRQPIYLRGADGLHRREEILETVRTQAMAAHPAIRKVVYVGDAKWDVTTTRNLSMDFIGIRREGDHDHLFREGATQVVSDYLDGPGFLRAVEQASPPVMVVQ